MKSLLHTAALCVGLLIAPASVLAAPDAKPDPKDDKTEAPALPADASARQSMRLAGRTLDYTATVGTLPVRDAKGKVIADVVFTAYTMPGKDRPVTFALNGGPGVVGVPQHGRDRAQGGDLRFEGDSASAPATLHDNPGTWLDFTDLVFIDPVGTGFSRARIGDDEAKKQLYNPVPTSNTCRARSTTGCCATSAWPPQVPDRRELRWLPWPAHHPLPADPAGRGDERPGAGLALPEPDPGRQRRRLADGMDADAAVDRRGAPGAPGQADRCGDARGGGVHPWRLRHRVDEGPQRSAGDRGDAAPGDRADRAGPAVRAPCRRPPETQAYLREVFRDKGTLGSRYDSNVTAFDPFPNDPEQRANDPLLDSIIAPTTTAMVDFVTRVVGWKVDARYQALNYDVNRLWDRNGELRQGAVTQLRQAVAIDPHLQVLIVHGWNDLSCPFMGSILTVDQMPAMGSNPDRVQVRSYPGGHMFYSRADSQAAFRKDVQALFQRN
jgi:carboxypeptidase C (cathepsin A)